MKRLLTLSIVASFLVGPLTAQENHQPGTPGNLERMLRETGTIGIGPIVGEFARLVRLATATCKQMFPADSSAAQYNCLLAMRDALEPPAHFGPCTNRYRLAQDGVRECWRWDETTLAWGWFAASAPTDSTAKPKD